jgi:hypothetical protein
LTPRDTGARPPPSLSSSSLTPAPLLILPHTGGRSFLPHVVALRRCGARRATACGAAAPSFSLHAVAAPSFSLRAAATSSKGEQGLPTADRRRWPPPRADRGLPAVASSKGERGLPAAGEPRARRTGLPPLARLLPLISLSDGARTADRARCGGGSPSMGIELGKGSLAGSGMGSPMGSCFFF